MGRPPVPVGETPTNATGVRSPFSTESWRLRRACGGANPPYCPDVRVITLTTDFGLGDWFVGTMKGVILGLAPRTRVVDLTHDVPAGDVRSGAFALAASYRFFPRGTIHVAVVDPGVGSARAAIVIETARYTFVGPDNGIFSLALAEEPIRSIHRLENHRYFAGPPGHTFHGRDIFAPVAAHLSRGVPISRLGPKTKGWVRLALPAPSVSRNGVVGEVIYIDRFGNAITNITTACLPSRCKENVEIRAGRARLTGLCKFYEQAKNGRPLALINSLDRLEIAVNRGNAAEQLDLAIGSRIVARYRPSSSNKRL